MWTCTVRAEHAAAVEATPEAAWSLLSSPLAWAVMPGTSMVFGIAASDRLASARPADPATGAGRLLFFLGPYKARAGCGILEVTDEVPGERVCVQSANRARAWELSVQPGRRGVAIRVVTSSTVARAEKASAQADLRKHVRTWAGELCAIIEGRRPWPAVAMPDVLRQACLATVAAPDSVEASASIQVEAPPETISRAFGTLELFRAVQPESVLYCGTVPGTLAGEVGWMRYSVNRRTDGLLIGRVGLMAARSPGGVIVRLVTPPYFLTTYRLEPAGPASTLGIEVRCPATHADGADLHRDVHERAARDLADRCKLAIESASGAGR